MPLPVIADVYRCVLVWSHPSISRNAINVMHFSDQLGTQTEANLNTDINACVTATMWTDLSTLAKVDRLDITKLDGSSVMQSFPQAVAAKWAGNGGNDCIPQGAALVKLTSLFSGRSNRGRLYLPFVGELGQTSGDLVDDAAMTTAWTTFGAAMSALDWDQQITSYTNSTSVAVQAYLVENRVATQRRRQPR